MCACADFPRTFFLNIVIVQNVGTRDLEGVPLGARMSNRVSRRFFRGVLSGNDMTLKWFPWVCAGATGSWGGVPVLFSGIFGYVVYI